MPVCVFVRTNNHEMQQMTMLGRIVVLLFAHALVAVGAGECGEPPSGPGRCIFPEGFVVSVPAPYHCGFGVDCCDLVMSESRTLTIPRTPDLRGACNTIPQPCQEAYQRVRCSLFCGRCTGDGSILPPCHHVCQDLLHTCATYLSCFDAEFLSTCAAPGELACTSLDVNVTLHVPEAFPPQPFALSFNSMRTVKGTRRGSLLQDGWTLCTEPNGRHSSNFLFDVPNDVDWDLSDYLIITFRYRTVGVAGPKAIRIQARRWQDEVFQILKHLGPSSEWHTAHIAGAFDPQYFTAIPLAPKVLRLRLSIVSEEEGCVEVSQMGIELFVTPFVEDLQRNE